MPEAVTKALALWGMADAGCELVSMRENHVYRVEHDGGVYALRLHRKGYRGDAELRSELAWMTALRRGGMDVPRPVADLSGALLQVIDGVQVDVLTWLPGAALEFAIGSLDAKNRAAVVAAIGRETAHLHDISDAWRPPVDFTRCAWDRKGLLGETPVWDRFWENPLLRNEERDLLCEFREMADRDLARVERSLDYGLIHADIIAGNMMIDGGTISFIDFDDGGFGFRLFDLATTIFNILRGPELEPLKAELIASYSAVRPLDTSALELMLALRAMTYVGWTIARQDLENVNIRSREFIDRACLYARNYLETGI